MRKSAWVSMLAVALLLAGVVPSHGRVVIGVGPIWWGPPYPYWYPPPYYAYPPPPVVVQEPPVYVQPAPEPAYWYYCPGAQGYYPNVQTCSEAWVRVPARPQ